jgi:NAD+ synthase
MTIDLHTESQKIVSFISETFKNTGKTTAVIGLSGGIDSTTSFTLTLKALGPTNIHAFYLPSKTSNQIHLVHIKELLSLSDFPIKNFHIIPINSLIQKSWRTIKHHSIPAEADTFSEAFQANRLNREEKSVGEETNKLRLANLSARIRMMILFDQAKKYDGLVVGTENKSESMLGYYTRFGDAASDLEPLAHLYKTQVIELSKYLNIPEPIIAKKPSADLWPGQTDATELGFSYSEADPILEQINLGKNPTGELAEKIKAAIDKAAFKSQVPYIPPLNLPLK